MGNLKNKPSRTGEGFFRYTVFWGAFFLFGVVLSACSSAPKGPAEIVTLRTMAQTQLELANRETDQENYQRALEFLEEARRLALSIDNPALLVRTGLSRGNVLFYLGRTEEAAGEWNAALAEAETAGDPELAALSRIHIARGRLLAASGPDGETGAGNTLRVAEEVRSRVGEEVASLKADRLAIALGWTVVGLAEKELRRWNDAEASLKKALDIHEGDNHLSEAAYDWFLIASIRSVAGRYEAALEALQTALGFDRRAENSYGLATDWRALGDVYTKMGDTLRAGTAYRRSGEIFEAIGLDRDAPRR
jgi:tetratricopeptide (TPR) repeat protein